ncbi:L-seryl-tRNA(Sec) selenium transferase [Bosea sp. NBC_00550]|uniref:L-seryl-tRNA(Sec) selenium transferase n=1 Tax=Bosea sp. NBC_00550 TaxID=2969621 RepID=UPI00222EB853|nr:L-seryl-tRNA(Sec) selenium transferase [Bosea sp. NBC_00550]UZF92959.1 L-seryl-tRNA(Sec) selenium transferase [Bosea sp. NBC_00550]
MNKPERFRPPSVDTVLRSAGGELAIANHGRMSATDAVRQVLDRLRAGGQPIGGSVEQIGRMALDFLEERGRPSQRPVINLTGTVLHTNLGRALLAEEAIEAVVAAMRAPTNLEYEIEAGQRGERDAHVRGLIQELTGAEDAILVNNNASAVLLVLNTLAREREAIVSRGELIEIGGAFRMPDIMARAGAVLREVGTTNRTHPRDYAEAIGPQTGLLMKVHTSNYVVQGFTAEVEPAELAKLARQHGLPFVDDLGSGTLIDLSRWGLRREKTVQDALKGGADLVTFSGDKLLGGPQAGIVAGRKDLIAKLAKNPLKRALRLDKLRLAALEATLRLYRNPDRLAELLPTLRLFTRKAADLRALAERLQPQLAGGLGSGWVVDIIDCASQIGSGALPLETLPSAGFAIRPAGKAAGSAVEKLAAGFRAVPVPVIGRIAQGALVFDLRCLEDEALFGAQISALKLEGGDGLA